MPVGQRTTSTPSPTTLPLERVENVLALSSAKPGPHVELRYCTLRGTVTSPAVPIWDPFYVRQFGIYIHTPWCRVRCPYCAFNVFLNDSADYPRWVSAILEAWRATRPAFSGYAHSLYFGGGPPSLAPPEAIAQLIHAMPLAPGAEITLEANPGQLDHRGLQALIQSGVNRLSVGVQTFVLTMRGASGGVQCRADSGLCPPSPHST